MYQQGCESCQKWRDHYTQEHMDVGRVRFFKLMTGDFTQYLSIPRKFGNSLKGNIRKRFILNDPSSKTWNVSVAKHADELFFVSGWGDFAEAHELQENDLLVFTLNGNRSFDVMIFDASGCEKVSSFFIGKRDPCCMCKYFDNMVVDQQDEHCISSDSDDTRLFGSAHKASASKKKKNTGKPKPREPESPDSSNYHIKWEVVHEEEQSEDSHGGSNYYYSRSTNILTKDERDEIFSLMSIQPGNPAFVTILQKSHMGRKNNMLIIQSGFAADHLEMRSHEMLLLRPNRNEKWHVRYYHGSSTRGFNCRRWFKFVSDNRLRKDDVCVFELIKKGARRKTMVVHVVRKVGGRFVLLG